VYQGCDEQFIEFLKIDESKGKKNIFTGNGDILRLLFVGAGNKHKGLPTLLKAIEKIKNLPIQLTIIGEINFDDLNGLEWLLEQDNISYLGNLSRHLVAREMYKSHVFILPSVSEGSSRALFESLASGLFPIISKNIGSIIINDVNGFIVNPSDCMSIANHINFLYDNPDYLNKVILNNRDIVYNNYLQGNFGDELALIFLKIINKL
jgi:glycosyltransferase involved in cell wall biosynthesis